LDDREPWAVIPVALLLGDVAAVPGGFLGVEVFFVVSGYLITTLFLGSSTRR
jgi:peptidoglycan/LPS O-acetylase OafA/YrhL